MLTRGPAGSTAAVTAKKSTRGLDAEMDEVEWPSFPASLLEAPAEEWGRWARRIDLESWYVHHSPAIYGPYKF